ncbi:DUF2188 domain-containing protein [Candidatus Gottesmanbacteria bacterium]|nr:DUF2188 domain-containing protein [Candidatus Gottesmanbacteria bacterium]
MKKFNSLPTISVPLKNPNNSQLRAYELAVEKGMQSQYVLPRNGSWIVKKPYMRRPTRVFSTLEEAVSYAKELAQNQGTAVFVHNREGSIQERFYFDEKP